MKCIYCGTKYSLWNGHICQHYQGIAAQRRKIKKALPNPAKGKELFTGIFKKLAEAIHSQSAVIGSRRESYMSDVERYTDIHTVETLAASQGISYTFHNGIVTFHAFDGDKTFHWLEDSGIQNTLHWLEERVQP